MDDGTGFCRNDDEADFGAGGVQQRETPLRCSCGGVGGQLIIGRDEVRPGEHGLLLGDLAGVGGAVADAVEADNLRGHAAQKFGACGDCLGCPASVLNGYDGFDQFTLTEGVTRIDRPLVGLGSGGGRLQQDDAFSGGGTVFLVDDSGDLRIGVQQGGAGEEEGGEQGVFHKVDGVGDSEGQVVQSRLRSLASRRRISR